MISAELASDLRRPDGTYMGMGLWMGLPYEPQYKRREAKYLAAEVLVVKQVLELIENSENYGDKNIVVDTTGSVIYTGDEVLHRLCRCTRVVHFSTPPQVQEQMLKAYIARKRPVLWRGMFDKKSHETNQEALVRCYSKLLFTRERLYEQIADVRLDYYMRNEKGFGVEELLKEVSGSEL